MTRIYLAGNNGRKDWLLPSCQWLAERERVRATRKDTFDNDILKRRWRSDDMGAIETRGGFDQDIASRVNLLESFYYVAEWQTRNLHRFKSFMLDSGAFTFAYGSKTQVNLADYLEQYIDYINQNNVELFFELDVDKLVGYERVLEYRKTLERGTGKRCIPVWHVSRGKENWLQMCKEYDYVALGGLAAKEFKNQESYIPWFTHIAHELGCKVHGLGYTKLGYLQQMGFDSVDSSAWLAGNRGGFVYQYRHNGCSMNKIQPPKGKKLNSRQVARHNFIQWVKLAEYLERT